MDEAFRSGFMALVGRPNAGKSSLINAVMGKKVAITSDTAQTTRHRFRAVLTQERSQLILVDTPGLHKPHDVLGEELNTSALKALEDVDAIAFLVDATQPVSTGDAWVAAHLAKSRAKKVLAITKTDISTAEDVARQIEAASKLAEFDEVIALSAKEGDNVGAFVELARDLLPEGPKWFPEDMETDQPLEVVVAEFIREKILRSFREEIPHAIGVVCDGLEYVRKKDLYRILATVYVEHESQKGMVIGKQGHAIRDIGKQAREDLETLLGCRVYLELNVKVKKRWRRDLSQIRRFGYGEGG